jgi:site-specific DNA-cytosine methylase
MKVLIACEESQAVTIEFRKLGIEAYSCDIKECTGGFPEWHIQGDALIEAYSGKYDLMIAHPPCTHLAVSGARHFKEKIKDGRQKESIEFFMKLANAPINHIVIENPICIMSKVWREPDQIIQPYYFGDEFQKTTCLWYKNMPYLKPTKIVSKGEFVTFQSGKRMSKWMAESFGDGTKRSKTFKGISEAMANQWKDLSKIPIQQVLELK